MIPLKVIVATVYAPGESENQFEVRAVDIRLGDILRMKKAHPCGSREWEVLRTGMDFRLRCRGCGHEILTPRSKAEKNIKEVIRDE